MIDPRSPDFSNTPASSRRVPAAYRARDSRDPVVSIITPYFNAGEEFTQTARSVLDQTLQSFEWLIVNDGSTEPSSLERLAAWRHADPRIHVIDHPHNLGLPTARNTGFRAARADLVLQLDADDLIEPTTAEKWAWHLATHPDAGFVNAWSIGFGALDYLWPRGFEEGAHFLKENVVIPTAMVRRSTFESAGGYAEDMRQGLEDWDFWLRCADAGIWGSTIPEYLSWYRRRPDHGARWTTWDGGAAEPSAAAALRSRHGPAERRFPSVDRRVRVPVALTETAPFDNVIDSGRRQLLLITSWLVMGGVDKFHLDLARQLTSRGWGVTIATTRPSDDPWLSTFAAVTPDIFRLTTFLPPKDHARFISYLIASRAPDVVMLGPSDLGFGTLPWLRARHPESTFIDFTHIEEPHWRNGGYPMRSVERREDLDLSLVTSQHLRRWMVERGADADRIEVCYINVDAEAWAPHLERREQVRSEWGVTKDQVVILYAARLCDQKRPDLFIRTIARLRDADAQPIAIVVGDGPEEAALLRSIARLRLSSTVRLLGPRPPEDMTDLMNAADIFFLPSRWEGIALSIYEAMACGLPVVASDVGGQRELVDADTGILVDPTDDESAVDAYVAALRALLEDSERRRRLGGNARARIVEGFTIDAMGNRFLTLVERARSQRRPPRTRDATSDLANAVAAARSTAVDILFAASLGSPATRRQRGIGALRRVYRWMLRRGWRWPERLLNLIRSSVT